MGETLYTKIGEKTIVVDKHLIAKCFQDFQQRLERIEESKQVNCKSHALVYYCAKSVCEDKTTKC